MREAMKILVMILGAAVLTLRSRPPATAELETVASAGRATSGFL